MRRISASLEASGVADAPAVAVEAGNRFNSRAVSGSRVGPETNPLKPEFSEMQETRKSNGGCEGRDWQSGVCPITFGGIELQRVLHTGPAQGQATLFPPRIARCPNS